MVVICVDPVRLGAVQLDATDSAASILFVIRVVEKLRREAGATDAIALVLPLDLLGGHAFNTAVLITPFDLLGCHVCFAIATKIAQVSPFDLLWGHAFNAIALILPFYFRGCHVCYAVAQATTLHAAPIEFRTCANITLAYVPVLTRLARVVIL